MTNDASLAPYLQEPTSPPAVPPAPFPWRRYFARGFDLALLQGLYEILLSAVFHTNFWDRSLWLSLLDAYLCWGILMLLEPLFLSRFGKTPGKWLFGLSIHRQDGGLLSYREALERTIQVFFHGEGYLIPFYSLYRNFKSYQICQDEGIMPWDRAYRYEAKPFRWFHAAGYFVLTLLIVLLPMFIQLQLRMPPHKGPLTTADFCQNYNYQLHFYGMKASPRLTDEGEWNTKERDTFFFPWTDFSSTPPKRTEEDGLLTSFSVTLEDKEGHLPQNPSEKTLLVISLLASQSPFSVYDLQHIEGTVTDLSTPYAAPKHISSVLTYIAEHPFQSYQIETGNLRFIQHVSAVGYESFSDDSRLFPQEDAEAYSFSMIFTMEQLPPATTLPEE